MSRRCLTFWERDGLITKFCRESRKKKMQRIQIFNNPEFGEIRAITIDGEPWFVGKDVAMALGYKDTSDALKRHVAEEDKLTRCFTDSGQNREMYVVNESGLYSLIFGSKLGTAKIFKRWVTSEILKKKKKTGTYSMNEKLFLDAAVAGNVADLGRVTERIMKGQGSAPHKIAEVFALECAQFGIVLPSDFVRVPDYEQMVLPCITK